MVTATACQQSAPRQGHFSLKIQWHGMPNTPSDSWEIVDMENSCLFLPLSFLPFWNCFHTHSNLCYVWRLD